jgi:hypothetical protein
MVSQIRKMEQNSGQNSIQPLARAKSTTQGSPKLLGQSIQNLLLNPINLAIGQGVRRRPEDEPVGKGLFTGRNRFTRIDVKQHNPGYQGKALDNPLHPVMAYRFINHKGNIPRYRREAWHRLK